MLNKLIARLDVNRGIHVHLNFAFSINNPSTEVPRKFKNSGWILLRLQFLSIAAQIHEHIMCLRTIHVYLVHEREFDTVLFGDSLLDRLVRLWFLIKKLVARECDYFETVLFVHLVQSYQRRVVLLSERSERGDIDNNHAFLIFHVIAQNRLYTVNVHDGNGPKFLHFLAFIHITASSPGSPKTNACLGVPHLEFIPFNPEIINITKFEGNTLKLAYLTTRLTFFTPH